MQLSSVLTPVCSMATPGRAWLLEDSRFPPDLYAGCIDPLEGYSLHARLSGHIAASLHRCCLLARTSRPGSLLELG